MPNILLALDAILALGQIGAEIMAMIRRAQSEGRDISDEEMAVIRSKRETAVRRFNELFGG